VSLGMIHVNLLVFFAYIRSVMAFLLPLKALNATVVSYKEIDLISVLAAKTRL
jgi:hypothetical protein